MIQTPAHRCEEIKADSAQSQKQNHKPPNGVKRANSMADLTAEPKAARERSGSAFFEKLPGFIAYQLGFS